MLNKEKYAKEILNIACSEHACELKNSKPFVCDRRHCSECECHQVDCSDVFLEWANSEYVESPVDWSKVSIDTPIMVRSFPYNEWKRRYFAGYENGKVYCWVYGATSWTANQHDRESCDFAKLAEEETRHISAAQTHEKQIQQKVVDLFRPTNQKDKEIFGECAKFGECPSCKLLVCSLWNHEYCGDCGQRLDWMDEEKKEETTMKNNKGKFEALAEIILQYGDLDTLSAEVKAFDYLEDQPDTIEELTEALEDERSYW